MAFSAHDFFFWESKGRRGGGGVIKIKKKLKNQEREREILFGESLVA
jgi:transcriptional regulator CtsR